MPSLYGVRGPGEGKDRPLVPPGIFIGRETDNDLQLPVAGVSRYHAKAVEQEDGTWRIVDLGSSNGIKVNGLRVDQQILSDGDLIHLGPVVLRFRDATPPPPAAATTPPSVAGRAHAQDDTPATATPDDAESRRRRFRDRDREIQRLLREAVEHKRRRLRRLALLLALLLNVLLISIFLLVMFLRSHPGG